MLLQIFVRRTFREILLIARARNFQAIYSMVESDQRSFVCRYSMNRGSVYALTRFLEVLLVTLIPQIKTIVGQLGRIGESGRKVPLRLWYSPARQSASTFSLENVSSL